MNLNQIIVLGFALFLLLWGLYPENEVHKECCKTVAPLTEEQKEIQNEFNEKIVSMDTNEINIDNHTITVYKNDSWLHLSSCKECLKRQGF
jgi:hypothetical protein